MYGNYYNNFMNDGYIDYGKLVLKTAPSTTPISLAQAKTFLRVDSSFDDDNSYITSLINVATQQVETFTRRRLLPQTYNLYHDYFPSYIDLQVGPIISVSSIKYFDNNNVEQTLATTQYDVDDKVKPGRIYESENGSFPDTYDRPNAINIEFIVGDNIANIPQPIIQAIYIIIGRYYENRQDVVIGTQANELPLMVEYLLTPYRYLEL